MRVRCLEAWHSADPLVEAHMREQGDFRVRWEVEVVPVEKHRMHASYRIHYVGNSDTPTARPEDFRIHQVTRVVVPCELWQYQTAENGNGAFTLAVAELLSNIREGDKIITLWEDDVWLHLEPNFVKVEFVGEEEKEHAEVQVVRRRVGRRPQAVDVPEQ